MIGQILKRNTQKQKKMDVYNIVSEPYNKLLEIYLDECNDFSDAKGSKMELKYNTINLTLDTCDYKE